MSLSCVAEGMMFGWSVADVAVMGDIHFPLRRVGAHCLLLIVCCCRERAVQNQQHLISVDCVVMCACAADFQQCHLEAVGEANEDSRRLGDTTSSRG